MSPSHLSNKQEVNGIFPFPSLQIEQLGKLAATLTKDLELLKDHVAFADDSGLATPSLFCHGVRHLDGLGVEREVGETIGEGWRKEEEVRVGDVV